MKADDVLQLLRKQTELYERLEMFAGKQRRLVDLADPTPLLSVLADRQRISTLLGMAASEFEPIRRDWNLVRQSLSASQRTEADRLLGGIGACLRRVIESDEEDARVLAARKQTVARNLRDIRESNRALDAYGAPESSSKLSRFDEES